MSDSSARLRVLHGKFSKYLSWSQPFLYRLHQGLSQRTDCVVICHGTENLHRFPTRRLYRVHPRYLTDASLALLASAEIQRRWDPQLLHAHFGWSAIRMVPLRQFLRVPLVTSFGGKDIGSEMLKPLFAPLYEAVLRISERIVCVSAQLARTVVERGADPERVVVIHRGTDLSFFDFCDRSSRSNQDPVQLLMVGRLVEKKGHRYAFQALPRLRQGGVDFQLTVVGQGDDFDALRSLALELGLGPLVRFVGGMDEAELRDQYRRADLLLHPSVTAADGDTEGLPNTVVEAAATGLPAIASRHGGIPEAVIDRQTGELIQERDVEGLVTAIDTLARDRRRRLEFGRAAAAHARQNFDIAHQVNRHVELYRELIDAYPPQESRMRRVFVGPEYIERLNRALRNDFDPSIVAQLERLKWSLPYRRRTPIFRDPSPSGRATVRRVGASAPEGLRRVARRLLGVLATTVSKIGGGARDGDILSAADGRHSAVRDFMESGGSVRDIDPGWSRARLAEFLLERRHDMSSGDQTNAVTGADSE
jgi:glycosyltransferase involved in cell wall biosynthesis